MNTRSSRTVAAAVALSVVAILAWPALAAARSSQDFEIAIKEVEPFPYCAIAHKGPFSDMGSVIGELVGAMQAQGLFPMVRGPMIGIYANSPADTKPEDLSWEAGFIIAAQTTVQPPLIKKSWGYKTVAAAVHVGPYEATGAAIEKIMAWLAARGYEASGPVLERYLDQNPSAVKPEELRTEVWIPCIRPERTK